MHGFPEHGLLFWYVPCYPRMWFFARRGRGFEPYLIQSIFPVQEHFFNGGKLKGIAARYEPLDVVIKEYMLAYIRGDISRSSDVADRIRTATVG